jgi:hypothetical protein
MLSMAQMMVKPVTYFCPERGKLYPLGLNEDRLLNYKRKIEYKIIKIINLKIIPLKRKMDYLNEIRMSKANEYE